MNEMENKFHERHIRWRDKTRDQLSFFNNLLLTISLGFLSFVFANEHYSQKLEICSVNQNLYIIISVVLILFSIFSGLMVVITRLYDFRITSHINQVRDWIFTYSNGMMLSNQSSVDYKCFHRIVLVIKVIINNFHRINFDECKKTNSKSDEEIELFFQRFEQLRTISHNLGNATWSNLKWQILLFFIGIVCFALSHFSI